MANSQELTALICVDTDWLGFVKVTVTRNDLGIRRALVLQKS